MARYELKMNLPGHHPMQIRAFRVHDVARIVNVTPYRVKSLGFPSPMSFLMAAASGAGWHTIVTIPTTNQLRLKLC
jgi:hypothetical protein